MKTGNRFILLHFLQPYFGNFDDIYFTFTVIYFSVTKSRAGGQEKERRYHYVLLSIKKYFWRRSSQGHRGNATIWLNHRVMRAAMQERVMVLLAKFAKSPGQNSSWVCRGSSFFRGYFAGRNVFIVVFPGSTAFFLRIISWVMAEFLGA